MPPALTVGVGTVATSRQLRANELADQYADAGVVCAITGTAALAEVAAAARSAGVESLVVHGGRAGRRRRMALFRGPTGWSRRRRCRPMPSRARPGPLLVYTSGTTGRARGAEVRWTVTLPETARDYVEAITAESAFPPGPHLVVGPLQHNAPLTSVRHLLAGQPVIIVGKFDAEAILRLIEQHRRHVVGDGADPPAAAAGAARRRPRAVRRVQPEAGEPDRIGLPGGHEARDDQLVRPDIR